MIRRLSDRIFAAIALVASRAAYRSVEVRGFHRIPRHRPVLIVANHFNGFVDPVMIAAALGRLPRFLAKATLWKVIPARPFLWMVGLVPVYRPEDGAGVAKNVGSFARADKVLLKKGVVAIFPEGTTHDRPHLDRIRTGAARIALSAYAAGAEDLVIVAVGLTFEDKVALRSRVMIEAAAPFEMGAERAEFVEPGATADDANHDAVTRLTEIIDSRLRKVAPNYETLREEGALRAAAEVALRTDLRKPQQVVPMGEREDMARHLAAHPPAERTRVSDELARYWLGLGLVGVTDDQLVPTVALRAIVWRFIRLAVVFVLLAPFALAGLFMNLVPAVLVLLAGNAVTTPVTKGTVRFLVGLIVFPVSWALIAIFDAGGMLAELLAVITFPLSPISDVAFDGRAGWGASLLVFFAAPLFGFAAVYIAEQWSVLHRVGRGWYVVGTRRALLPELLVDRAELVEDVKAVTNGGLPQTTMATTSSTEGS